MRIRLMPRKTITWLIVAAAAVVVLVLLLLISLPARTPELPNGWGPNSVWMRGHRSALSLRPQGAWVDCRLDTERNVDTCKFGDYRGRVFFEHTYDACNGGPPLANDKLQLRNEGSIWILRLQNGTLLFQTPCPPRHTSAGSAKPLSG